MHRTRLLLVSDINKLRFPSKLKHMISPRAGHPHLEHWRSIGRKYTQRWHGPPEESQGGHREECGTGRERQQAKKTSRIQAIRSVSDWSHGVLTEASIQEACQCCFEPRFKIFYSWTKKLIC